MNKVPLSLGLLKILYLVDGYLGRIRKTVLLMEVSLKVGFKVSNVTYYL